MWYKTEAGKLINLDNATNVQLLPEGINNKCIVGLNGGKCTFVTDKDAKNIERLLAENNLLQTKAKKYEAKRKTHRTKAGE